MISKRGYSIKSPYIYDHNIAFRWLRRMHFRIKAPRAKTWFNEEIAKCSPKTIVVFESLISWQFLNWLRRVHPKSRIIVWYWNIAKNTIDPNSINDGTIEKWTFSRRDAIEYNMKFNPPPYFREISMPQVPHEYDISFVGRDKGRLKQLLFYKEVFTSMGLKTKFIITPERKWKHHKEYHKPISYNQVLDLSSRSKAVFDYIEVCDSGQSMRVFEALFHEKKLITNSRLIIDYDFYKKGNIFVLDGNIDDMTRLKDFIESPYEHVDLEIVLKYDFENWLKRFFAEDSSVANMLGTETLQRFS